MLHSTCHLQIFPLMGKNEGWGSTSSNWRGSKVRELVVNNDFPTAILWTITSILPPVTNHFLIFEQERGNWGSVLFIPSQVRVSCCLLPTQLFISPRVQTRTQDRRSRVQQTITTTNYYSTQQFSTSFPLINIQRELDNSTWSGKLSMKWTRIKRPNIL